MGFWAEPHETIHEGMAIVEKNLNDLVRDGWELVAFKHEVLILKRQVRPQQATRGLNSSTDPTHDSLVHQ